MNVLEWLQSNDKAALKRIAELICVNGGSMDVQGNIGSSAPTDQNRYGRIGLTVPEACELIYMKGVTDGLLLAHNNAQLPEMHRMIQGEIYGMVIQMPTPNQAKELLKPCLKLK